MFFINNLPNLKENTYETENIILGRTAFVFRYAYSQCTECRIITFGRDRWYERNQHYKY